MNPILTTHSGANNQEENSQDYLNSCIGSSAKYIEVDVRKTKDNILVLSHDSNIKSKKIQDTSFSELKSLKPSLITINIAFEYAQKYNFFINFDLKNIDAAQMLAKSIVDNNFIDKCVISGCHDEETKTLLNYNKKLKVVYNLEKDDIPKIESVIKKILSLKVYGINLNHKLLSKNLVDSLKKANLPIFVWTVDTNEEFDNCKNYEITSITSNNPDLFNQKYSH